METSYKRAYSARPQQPYPGSTKVSKHLALIAEGRLRRTSNSGRGRVRGRSALAFDVRRLADLDRHFLALDTDLHSLGGLFQPRAVVGVGLAE